MSNYAQVGKTVGVSIGNTSYLTVGAPDLVTYAAGINPDSDLATITEAADPARAAEELAADIA